ncbi:MAG: SulP family inorganic anion transporter [Planctomycetota bacterium]
MQKTGPLDIFREAKHWKTDIPSGLVVFLVAIPLCLGIALASGGTAMSGIIAGIVGGLIVTLFSNSSLGVSGPAAGLVAIVAPAISQLGFENFLLAVVLSGVIQFLLGLFKAGTIGYYFPTSVIKGMLAAIGLIIILKQIPHALGYDKDYEGDMAFSQADGHNTFSEIYYALSNPSTGPVIVTLVCLAILIIWQTKIISKFSWSKIIQGPLVAVVAGILLNLAFFQTPIKIDEDHLVQLNPKAAKKIAGIDDEEPADANEEDSKKEAGGFEFKYPHFEPSGITSADVQIGHGSHGGGSTNAAVAIKDAITKLDEFGKKLGKLTDSSIATNLKPAIADVKASLSSTGEAVDSTGIELKKLEEAIDKVSNQEIAFGMKNAISGIQEVIKSDAPEGSISPFRAGFMIFVTAMTLAIVASLESLLCAEATDKLDPQRRQTDLNQELRAQGIGNFVSGMIGGLPVTQVIVRSSTNIQSGAQSRFASFVHGIFLIACVIAIPNILELIPLASLAAILFVVGYKLAHPSKFKAMYSQGWTQFLPFIITIVAILWTDLLIGIGIGLIASLFFILRSSYFKSLWLKKVEVDGKTVHRLTLAERVFFINKGNIQAAIQDVAPGSKVIVDASNTVHMDQDVIDIFNDFKTQAEFDDIEIEWISTPGEAEQTDPARIQQLQD